VRGLTTILLLALLFTSPLWATPPTPAGQTAGKITDISGKTAITHPGGKPFPASVGETVFLGDILETKSDGAIKILFADDTLLIIKENSRVLLSEFLFDAKAKKRKVVFNAPFGTIRTIIGRSFGKDQLVEIQTPVAVSGIRGTDIGAHIQSKATIFYCFFCKKEVVQITNIRFPKQPVFLTTGQAIEIVEGKPILKEDILPIPKDILEKRETLFNFQAGTMDKRESRDLAGQKEKEEELLRSIPSTMDSDTPINPGGVPESQPAPPGGGGNGGGKM